MSSKIYQGELIMNVKKNPILGFIFKSRIFRFFWENKNDVIVIIAKTSATGPLVKIAKLKNIHGDIHISFLEEAILLQNNKRLIPKFPHRRPSLTAVLLQIITNGDKAKHKEPNIGTIISLSPLFFRQYKVSPINSIRNNDDKAEGSLAEIVP